MRWFPEAERLLIGRPEAVDRPLRVGWDRVAEALGERLEEICRLLPPTPRTACLHSWRHILGRELRLVLETAPPGDLALLLPCADYAIQCTPQDVIRAILAAAGPAKALETVVRGFGLALESDGERLALRESAHLPHPDASLPWRYGQIRQDILRRSPEAMAALIAELRPIRPGFTPFEQCLLSWFLPTDAEGAAAAARRCLEEPPAPGEALLLSTDLDPDLALQLWRRADDGTAIRCAAELARLLQEDGYPPLAALLDRLRAIPHPPGPLLTVLAVYPQAAPLLARDLDQPDAQAVAHAFFERHPDLAAIHLADLLGQRTQRALRATALLTRLARLRPADLRPALPLLDPRPAARLQRLLDADQLEADPDEWPDLLRAPPWRRPADSPDPRADLPTLPPRPIDELTLHALMNRNRAADNDSYFLGKRERVRQIADIALTANPARGPAIALLRYLHGLDPQTLSLLDPRDKQAILRCLDMDLLLECPDQPQRLPTFLTLKALPRPRLRSGASLPVPAVEVIAEALSFSPRFPAYAGLAAIRDACDPESLSAFAWALAAAWVDQGMPVQHGWMFLAVGHLGDDATPRRLTTWIRKKLREDNAPAALVGLEALGLIPRDAALLQLHALSRGSGAIDRRAQELIQKLARIRGLSREELEERLIPDLDLDPDGGCTLDYGPRKFQVRLDEHLTPQIFNGPERLPALPRPNRDDDPALAAAASERWKGLKADARTVTTQLRRRLEGAMLSGHRWPLRTFRALFLHHPLLSLIARRLLWSYREAGRLVTFRISEDGTPADALDQPVPLPSWADLTLPHPLEIPDLDRWLTILSDYNIMQPFPQVSRDTYRPSPAELSRQILPDLPQASAPWGKLRGALEHRGWIFKPSRTCHFERSHRDATATLDLSENPFNLSTDTPIAIAAARFSDRIGRISPIVYSELRRDLLMFL